MDEYICLVLVLCLLGMFKTMLSCLTEFESLLGVIKGHLMAVELTKALLVLFIKRFLFFSIPVNTLYHDKLFILKLKFKPLCLTPWREIDCAVFLFVIYLICV